jgi:hypothetical protein
VPEKFLGSDLFKKEVNHPTSFEEHPLFNPKTVGDYPDLLGIFEKKRKAEKGEKNKVLKLFYEEVLVDREIGKGKTSVEKMVEINQQKDCGYAIICSHCHYRYQFEKSLENSCPQCSSNPSYYKTKQKGPYKKFGIFVDPKPVEVYFQEPKPFSPVGENLIKIYQEFNETKPPDDIMFATGQDGLINVA